MTTKRKKSIYQTLKKKSHGGEEDNYSEDCPICAEPMIYDICITNCGHSFHLNCLLQWYSRSTTNTDMTCPACRSDIRLRELDFTTIETKGEIINRMKIAVEELRRLRDESSKLTRFNIQRLTFNEMIQLYDIRLIQMDFIRTKNAEQKRLP